MNGYRITKRGKAAIYVISFLIIFLIGNFIFKLHVNAYNSIKRIPFNNKTNSQGITLLNKQDITINNNNPNLILSKTTSSVKSETLVNNQELSYTVESAYVKDGKKIAFLTFDDGPSSDNTLRILQILKFYKIKATFFIIGSSAEKNRDILKAVVNDGHAIGNHTYSHVYKTIYSNVPTFINEIKKTDSIFKDVLGSSFSTRLVRFPGGAFQTTAMKPFVKELNNEGYVNIDWNVINGDGEGTNIPPDKLLKKLKDTVLDQSHLVILMHDSSTKRTSVETLPQIIEYLKAKGYEFATLR